MVVVGDVRVQSECSTSNGVMFEESSIRMIVGIFLVLLRGWLGYRLDLHDLTMIKTLCPRG